MKTKENIRQYCLLNKKLSNLALIMFFVQLPFAICGQPVISNDSLTEYEVEARIRNGKTGFEAALFTPSTPAPGEPGGGEWQLDPPGAPVWNSQGNVYGDFHNFRVTYDPASGTSTLAVDFNRDNDYLDTEEFTSSTSASLTGNHFTHINLFLQGALPDSISAEVTSLVINGYSMGNFISEGNLPTEIVFEEQSGYFSQIDISGQISFSGGSSQEIPRIWIRLGNHSEPCLPSITPLPISSIIGSCQVQIADPPKALNGCGDTLIGFTIDPLYYDVVGNYSVHWTFTDVTGTMATYIQVVQVIDTLKPLPDQLILPVLYGVCNVEVVQRPTATDNCAGSIVAITSSPLSYTVIGNYSIQWEYTDPSGNLFMQWQDVVVDSIQLYCAEDLNRDSMIDGMDFLQMLGKVFTPCECCVEDFNHNDFINGEDYLRLLGQLWRKCDE